MNLKPGLTLLFMVFTPLAVGQAKPRQATLAQQKMCADQARRAFKESYTAEYEGI